MYLLGGVLVSLRESVKDVCFLGIDLANAKQLKLQLSGSEHPIKNSQPAQGISLIA